MSDLNTANDCLMMRDGDDSVYLEALEGFHTGWVDLSVTDVESIHEWTGQWLRNRDAGRKTGE